METGGEDEPQMRRSSSMIGFINMTGLVIVVLVTVFFMMIIVCFDWMKDPKHVPVDACTDNKSLWEILNNTRQCEEKLLRNSIALVKEMVEKGEVKNIEWVETSNMLADILTKKGGNSSWIKNVVSRKVV